MSNNKCSEGTLTIIPPPCYEPDCSTCPYAGTCRKSNKLKITWTSTPEYTGDYGITTFYYILR
jgi:hypothetical protein